MANYPFTIGKVTVNNTSKPEQQKTVEISENGVTTVTPDEGYVLSKVTVNTNVARAASVFTEDNSAGGTTYTINLEV